MSNGNWTKGEWVVRGEEIGIIDQSDTQSYGMMNVICRVDKYDVKEWQENTHLIAAAPKLYEALKELVAIVDIHQKATQENFAWAEMPDAIEALKKARGEL